MRTLQVAAVITSLLSLGAGQAGEIAGSATRSVNFKPFRNDDTEWTWRVNVTDLYPRVGPRRMEFGYDFSWPGGGKLSSTPAASKNPNGTFCTTAVYSWGTAKNITAKYTEANTQSTDCTPVVGSACVNAILTASAENDDGTARGCFERLWSQYPECADTFGIDEYAPYGTHKLLLDSYELSPRHIVSGARFHSVVAGNGDSSGNASLPELYENAVNMLQVVLLRPPVGPGEAFAPTLNCMRVNTKEVVDVGEGEGEGDSDGNTEDGNSGAGRVAAASLWAVMGSLAVGLL